MDECHSISASDRVGIADFMEDASFVGPELINGVVEELRPFPPGMIAMPDGLEIQDWKK
jgi:hypothetical protein